MRKTIILLLAALLVSGCSTAPQKVELTPEEKAQKAAPITKDADFEFSKHRYMTALFHYEQVLEYTPTDYHARLRIADIHRLLGNYDMAKQKYQQLIDENAADIDAQEGYALSLFEEGDYKAAKERFLALIEQDAMRWRSLNSLGVIEDMRANYAGAHDYYRRALKADPDNVTVINNLGYSLIMAHKYRDAEKELKYGLLLSPDFFRLRNNLSIAHAWQKEYTEAVEVLVPVLPYEVAYNNVGYIAMLNGDYEKARFYLKKAIFTSPRYYLQAVRNLEKLDEITSGRKQKESFTGD